MHYRCTDQFLWKRRIRSPEPRELKFVKGTLQKTKAEVAIQKKDVWDEVKVDDKFKWLVSCSCVVGSRPLANAGQAQL